MGKKSPDLGTLSLGGPGLNWIFRLVLQREGRDRRPHVWEFWLMRWSWLILILRGDGCKCGNWWNCGGRDCR